MSDQGGERGDTNSVSKDEVVGMITSALKDAESAIHSHPKKTIALYELARKNFEGGMLNAGNEDWSVSTVTMDEMLLINRYFLATAFMSAWWALKDDEQRRVQTAETATNLVSALGIPKDQAISRYNQIEHLFIQMLSESSGNPACGCILFLLIIGSLGAAAWYLFA